MTRPYVNSFDGWSPLEEVWLGDVYPASWYDHLDSEIKDVFYEITEKSKYDLNLIQRKIESFGVTVRRPQYEKMEDYLLPFHSENLLLVKPQITPRDTFSVIGNRLLTPPTDHKDVLPWQQILRMYQDNGDIVDHRIHNEHFHLNGANIIRAGKDIYIDAVGHHTMESTVSQAADEFSQIFGDAFQGHRLHFLQNGGHMDGCMAILKPGLVLCNRYFSDYSKTFPLWTLIKCQDPEFYNHRFSPPAGHMAANNKWFMEGRQFPNAFNEHVINHALDWVGDYTESFFEVNCLSIDEKNVLVLGEHDKIFRALEEHGITAHPLPFRCRSFWDSGLHCMTVDIRRQSHKTDYFPERDTDTIYLY